MQDDVDKVMVSHIGIDIASIDIVQVFQDTTGLLEITNLVESPVRLIGVAIVCPNGVPDFLPGSIPVLISFPLFQSFTFRPLTNVRKSLLFVASSYNGKVIIQLKDPSFQVLRVKTKFRKWWSFACYYLWMMALMSLGW